MEEERYKTILKVSITGIVVNLLLATLKALVGVVAHSIAIVMDALNNLTDSCSAAVTIIGTRLAAKEPDKKHPFGYGRVEYLAALVIAGLILYVGVRSFAESVNKIIHPETPEYSVITLIIISVAILTKIFLSRYVKAAGKKVDSGSLVASGSEAMLDALVSGGTLAAALLYLAVGIDIESWLAAVISLLIIKAGYDILAETVSKILGEGAKPELVMQLKETVNSFDEVDGCFDVVLNNYGPDSHIGSLHIAVEDTMTADRIDDLIRRITEKVYAEHHVLLSAVSLYSINTHDEEAIAARNRAAELVIDVPYIKAIHGFHISRERKQIRFDLVVSFDAPSRKKAFNEAVKKVQNEFPDYKIIASMDVDFNELN